MQEPLQQRAIGEAGGKFAMIEAGEGAGDVGSQGEDAVFREAFEACGRGVFDVDFALGKGQRVNSSSRPEVERMVSMRS